MITKEYVKVLVANTAETQTEISTQDSKLIGKFELEGSKWYRDTSINNSIGVNGDFLIINGANPALNIKDGSVYFKENETWVYYFNITGAKQATFKNVKNITSTSYTLIESDWENVLQCATNSSDELPITVPVGLPANIRFEIRKIGTAPVRIIGATGVTIRHADTELPMLSTQYSVCAIEWIKANEFIVYGHLDLA